MINFLSSNFSTLLTDLSAFVNWCESPICIKNPLYLVYCITEAWRKYMFKITFNTQLIGCVIQRETDREERLTGLFKRYQRYKMPLFSLHIVFFLKKKIIFYDWYILRIYSWDLLVVQLLILCLLMRGLLVPSLVEEIRSHMPHSQKHKT